MKPGNFSRLNLSFSKLNNWVNQISLERLDIAYNAAVAIKEIEKKHFNSNSISSDANKGKILNDYFRVQLQRELANVRLHLAEFKLGTFLVNHKLSSQDTREIPEIEALILEKLSFIESVVSKYRQSADPLNSSVTQKIGDISASNPLTTPDQTLEISQINNVDSEEISLNPLKPKKSRSLLGRFGQVRKELSPEYEQKVITELRTQRRQNQIAIRWLVILAIVPIVAHTLTKSLIVEPLLTQYSEHNAIKIELNEEIRENFMTEFGHFKQSLEVRQLVGTLPEMTQPQTVEMLKEEAVELWRESRAQALNGLKNVLADGMSLIIFVGLVYLNRDKLIIVRRFLSRTFIGLNDPTKVFLFILITDLFVGFHSAEGWEVLLEGIALHFGLPENKTFIHTFIATVPVMIDSFTKFWIFNYLTQYSPISSAIYERMNT
jgi:hypothetical protein